MAEQNLKRCDSVCFKILVAVIIVAAWSFAVLGHVTSIAPATMGWFLMLSVVGITILRTILFVVMDSKGI